ncbi:MAG: PIG-L family deacetylase [Nitrospinota bacterium]|nr:PIG-L family deacetylase [Nitrospinota bacterium]
MVIAPHPDDETLGPGGTLLRRGDEGWRLYWLIVTPGLLASDSESLARRDREIEEVATRYGFAGVHRLDLPPSALDRVSELNLYEGIAEVIRETLPSEVWLPFRNDPHSDHRVVNAIGWSCCKSFRFPSVRRVLMYDTPSETDFAAPGNPFEPDVLVDITGYADRKLDIMGIYQSEMGQHPFPRSPEVLAAKATLYGAMAGCEAAEGFMLMREIDSIP